MKLLYGDAAARKVSERIAEAVATTTALKAVPPDRRVDGMLASVLLDYSLWVFDVDSSESAGAKCLVPTSGAGRWLLIGGSGGGGAGLAPVRGVVAANVADLTAFTVASNDGLTYAEGDRVALVKQTTAAQCGIYVVGPVASTTAPLTRSDDFPSGAAIVNGTKFEVSEGTLYAGSTWKAMCTGACVVGTDDPLFYPRIVKAKITLAGGSSLYALGATEGLWLFSATKSVAQATLNTPAGTLGTWGLGCPSTNRTAGKVGTAALRVQSFDAAGTAAGADTSTVDVLVVNW